MTHFASECASCRGAAGLDGFDVVVTNRPGTDLDAWERAGATWCLTGWGPQPSVAEVERVIDAGPQAG